MIAPLCRIFCLTTLFALVAGTSAIAQSPEDLVRWIYTSLNAPGPAEAKSLEFLSAPAQREQYFSGRLAALYTANDPVADDPAQACIDFGPAIPGNDFDPVEIQNTLQLSSQHDSEAWIVVARFSSFGTPAEIIYSFIAEGSVWQLDDIAQPGAWTLSEIVCPKPAAPVQTVSVNSYCYQTESDALRMDIQATGNLVFELTSWQGGGHFCGISGRAAPGNGVWIYEENMTNGSLCRLSVGVAPNGDIQISDQGDQCRTTYCGQRAVLSNLTLPASSQRSCEGFSAN